MGRGGEKKGGERERKRKGRERKGRGGEGRGGKGRGGEREQKGRNLSAIFLSQADVESRSPVLMFISTPLVEHSPEPTQHG